MALQRVRAQTGKEWVCLGLQRKGCVWAEYAQPWVLEEGGQSLSLSPKLPSQSVRANEPPLEANLEHIKEVPTLNTSIKSQ